MARAFLIYGGERELNESGIQVLSFETALAEMANANPIETLKLTLQWFRSNGSRV
jgi:hypothetical protein